MRVTVFRLPWFAELKRQSGRAFGRLRQVKGPQQSAPAGLVLDQSESLFGNCFLAGQLDCTVGHGAEQLSG